MESQSSGSHLPTTNTNLNAEDTNVKYILLNKSTIVKPPFNADISNKLLRIEYPGFVENIDKAVETLGGIHAIETAVGNSNRRLELRYRPKDVFSKPCWGEKDYNPGILVKIKVSQPVNSKSEDVTTYSYEIIGATAMTFKFSRLCDFQYLPLVPTNKKKETADSTCQYIYDDIIPKELPTWEWFTSQKSISMPLFFAPPIFSRFNTSKDNKLYFERYKYYEALIPEFAEKLKKDAQKKKPEHKNIITRSRSERKLYSVFINPIIKDTVIPTEPTKEALETLQRLALDGELFQETKKLFAERPIWSKAAISHQTGIRYDRLKYILPCVGYYFSSGPWRVMWCRFGFDPRLDPSSRIYQTFDFRIRTSDGLKVKVQPKRGFSNIMHYKAGRATTEKFSLKDCCLQKPSYKPIPTEDNYILKPNMLPAARQMFYQYCDLHIPEIQKMLKRLPEVTKGSFDVKIGWLPVGFVDQCREIANRYIMEHVKSLLLEDKKQMQEGQPANESHEEKGASAVEDYNLPSPISILDDDEEEEAEGLYSDGEDDPIMESDDDTDLQITDNMDKDIDLDAVDEINKLIGNVQNISTEDNEEE